MLAGVLNGDDDYDNYEDYPVLAKFAQKVIIVRDSILSSSV